MIEEGILQPQAREAEQALLGAVLINPGCYREVESLVSAEDFFIQRHGMIWEMIARLMDQNMPVDVVTLVQLLEQAGMLEEVGGPAYLTALINNVPSSMHAEGYGRLIEQAAVRRRMLEAANQTAGLVISERPLDEVIEEAMRLLLKASERVSAHHTQPLQDILLEVYQELEHAALNGDALIGLSTGFLDLDQILSGLQRANLVIVAGRPGTGKTSFLTDMAIFAASQKKKVVLYSLEMSSQELGMRMLAGQSRIDSQKMRTGRLGEKDWAAISEAIRKLQGISILVDDTPALTPAQLRARCKWLAEQQGLDLVLVDYLQLMRGGERYENRQVEVSQISRQLKALAKELNIPVLAAAQLSRAVEQRADKIPQLSDLRESGSIEQDADVVLFLHRQEEASFSSQGARLNPYVVGVEVAKHRSGPTGKMKLLYTPSLTRFDNLARGNLGGL